MQKRGCEYSEQQITRLTPRGCLKVHKLDHRDFAAAHSQSGRSHKCFLFLKLEHEVAILHVRVNSYSKDLQQERQQQLSLHSCCYKRKIFATSLAFLRA